MEIERPPEVCPYLALVGSPRLLTHVPSSNSARTARQNAIIKAKALGAADCARGAEAEREHYGETS